MGESKSLRDIKIKEIMTKNVTSIRVDEPFSRVEEKFRDVHIRHLPVVDDLGQLVGIVTQRDLYRIQSPRLLDDGSWYYDKQSLDNHILKYVMTPKPLALKPENSVFEALQHMVIGRYGSIPIVDDAQKLCGIITRSDVLRTIVKIS